MLLQPLLSLHLQPTIPLLVEIGNLVGTYFAPVSEKRDTSVSLTFIQVGVHTSKNLRKAASLFAGPGKWPGFKLFREHRETPELDFGFPTRLVALPFISCLSLNKVASAPCSSCIYFRWMPMPLRPHSSSHAPTSVCLCLMLLCSLKTCVSLKCTRPFRASALLFAPL